MKSLLKKVSLIMLVIFLASSLLVGCGGGQQEESQGETPDTPAETPADTPAETSWELPVRSDRDPIPVGELKVGVILIHDENSGYDMAHIEGIRGAMKKPGTI
jgi:basic membrane protein A